MSNDDMKFYKWTNIECLQEQSGGLVYAAASSLEEVIYAVSEVLGRTPEEVIEIANALSSTEPEVTEYDAPL